MEICANLINGDPKVSDDYAYLSAPKDDFHGQVDKLVDVVPVLREKQG